MPDTVVRVLGMGAITGLRSTAGPAALSRAAANGRIDGLEDTPFAALGSPRVSTALRMMGRRASAGPDRAENYPAVALLQDAAVLFGASRLPW